MHLTKATSDQVAALFNMCYSHEMMEGDEHERRRLVRFAADNQLTHLLPDHAHGTLHELNLPHKHEGMDEEHYHTITKAFTPEQVEVVKSWEEGGTTYVEGWIAPNTRDMDKDIVEPEAFKSSLDGYFTRCAPVSANHGLERWPIGHMQKAALIRDGKVFHESTHPLDPADFKQLPTSGSGWYGRVVINDPQASASFLKGNIGGFSWKGTADKWEKIPGGGSRFTNVSHLLESTVAAYPRNPDAVARLTKAQETPQMTLEEMFAKILENQNATPATPAVEQPVQKGVTEDRLVELLTGFKTEVEASVTAQIQKALDEQIPARGEGAGRKLPEATPPSNSPQAVTREDNPVQYLVQKASTGELDQDDSRLLWELSHKALTSGMNDSDGVLEMRWV